MPRAHTSSTNRKIHDIITRKYHISDIDVHVDANSFGVRSYLLLLDGDRPYYQKAMSYGYGRYFGYLMRN